MSRSPSVPPLRRIGRVVGRLFENQPAVKLVQDHRLGAWLKVGHQPSTRIDHALDRERFTVDLVVWFRRQLVLPRRQNSGTIIFSQRRPFGRSSPVGGYQFRLTFSGLLGRLHLSRPRSALG